ncbi:MAG: hypothetical protein IJ794_20010 [Lachnospiraceae bacterium]|nr:hypothetical protein [Lachnospiraceae bacterium]
MKRLRKWLQSSKSNNRGSALLTVILVVAFLTILATTLLYITGMNFVIKQADYQNKKNFYTGETALEEIRAKLMEDIVSVAAEEAFNRSCKNYVSQGVTDVRALEYNGYFVEEVGKALNAKLGAGTWTDYLNTCYTDHTHGTLTVASPGVTRDGAGDLSADVTYQVDTTKGIVIIKGLEMEYINDKSLATLIATDIELEAPALFTERDPALGLPDTDKIKVDVSRSVRYTNWEKR